uniref:J domain-containing protein n=1 Tax=Alexandrium monilatum TaxID=311494 RepID=A0A7S4SHS3_9DINO
MPTACHSVLRFGPHAAHGEKDADGAAAPAGVSPSAHGAAPAFGPTLFVFGQTSACGRPQPPPSERPPAAGDGYAGPGGCLPAGHGPRPPDAASEIFRFGAGAPEIFRFGAPPAEGRADGPGPPAGGGGSASGMFVFGGGATAPGGAPGLAVPRSAGLGCPPQAPNPDVARAGPPARPDAAPCTAQQRRRGMPRRRAPREPLGPPEAWPARRRAPNQPLRPPEAWPAPQEGKGGGSTAAAAVGPAAGAAAGASEVAPAVPGARAGEAAPRPVSPASPASPAPASAPAEDPPPGCDAPLAEPALASAPTVPGPRLQLGQHPELLTGVLRSLEERERLRAHEAERRSLVERAERERLRAEREARAHEEERLSLVAQLQDARERSAELPAERRRRKEAEAAAATLRQRMQQREAEAARLRQQLREVEQRACAVPGRGAVVGALARLECEPLRCCAPQERAQLKKRLLLKWHPDKQPSAEHAELSKLVMQELQNREEWAW